MTKLILNAERRIELFLRKHQLLHTAITLSLIGMLIMVVSVGVFVFTVASGNFGSLPSNEELKAIKTYEASAVFTADGVEMGKYFIENRSTVELEDVSPNVLKALIATEDVRFYDHKGIDFRSWGRVLFKTIMLQKESSGGGSTITQQLAKNLYPRKKYSILTLPINKIKESLIAQRLEQIYTKDEILKFYLNTISFGEDTYGIGTAAKRYYSSSPDDLTLDQAATLIGMLKATTLYNPRRNPKHSMQRRNVVIGQMEKYDFITKEEAIALKNEPLNLSYNYVTHSDGIAPYFRETLRLELDQFVRQFNKPDGIPYNIYTDGLRIFTTLDSKMQKYAEESVVEHLHELQDKFFTHWGKREPWENHPDVIEYAIVQSKRYQELFSMNMTDEEIRKTFEEPVPMTIFTYNGEVDTVMTPLDSIKYYMMHLKAGFMVMEPNTGFVRAWVGGVDHHHFKYDHVKSKRQTGSTFKPLVYATALETGMEPCDYFDNNRSVYNDFDEWSPRNADNEYGGRYSMQGALAKSINVVSVKVMLKTGVHRVINLARKAGIYSDLPNVPSLALGTADVSLFEMVNAYSIFPNRGTSVVPVYIYKIEDRNGKVIYENAANGKKERVISEINADIMNHMLQDVVNNGTGRRLRFQYELTTEISGKTGTTQSYADGWFMGYTSNLVAGAWVGGANRTVRFRTLDLGQGARMALPIWGSFMKKIKDDEAYQHYLKNPFAKPPEDVIEALNCPNYREPIPEFEFFTDGNQPFIEASDRRGFFDRMFRDVFRQ